MLTFLALQKVRRMAGRDPPVLLLILFFQHICNRYMSMILNSVLWHIHSSSAILHICTCNDFVFRIK